MWLWALGAWGGPATGWDLVSLIPVITEACTMRQSGTALSFLWTEVSRPGLGSVQELGTEVPALKRDNEAP